MGEKSDFYYSPYDKTTTDVPVAPITEKGSRPINLMDPDKEITLGNGDTQAEVDQKMDNFLKNGGYIDFIFGEDKLESITALGVRIDYAAGTLNIVGMPKKADGTKYKIKIYTLRDGVAKIKNSKNEVVEAADYRVVTYNQDITFTSGDPAIVDISIGKDGIFRVDYIDTTQFGSVAVHFSTKMPYEIKKPEITNIFRDSSLITQTGEVTRVTEFQYDSAITEKTAISGMNVMESDLRGYKLPLDIVFCIDNSGSMANEIAKVRAGLKSFSKTLVQRGFDVKYNLITFGPAQTNALNGNFTGIQFIKENSGDSSAYMVQFKQKWFDGTYAVNKNPTNEEIGFQTGDSEEEIAFKKQQYIEVNELEKAFSGIGSTGGYYEYQENSVWAFDRAKTLLDTNGRAVDYKGSIITAEQASSTPTTMKSLKWIIFLTDEGIDNDTAPSGYSKKASGVVPKTTVGSTEIPTVIKEMGDNLNQSGIYLTGIHHIGSGLKDRRGIAGVTSSDTGDGVIYNQYAVVMGDKYNGYEMGRNGEETTDALLDSVSNIGIIQRWKLTYNTPFDKADGTFRQVNFVPANLTGTNSTVKISPKDVNPVAAADSDVGGRTIVATRKYKAPAITMDVEIINPKTDGVFNFVPSDVTKVIIEGKAMAIDEKTKVPSAPQKVTIKVFNNSNRTLITSLDYMVNATSDKLMDGYYKFYVEVPVSELKQSGAKLFDISAIATRTGMSGETEEKRVSLDSGAPKLLGLEVLNTTTDNFWKSIKKPERSNETLFSADTLNSGKLSKLKYDYLIGQNSYSYGSEWNLEKNITLSERMKEFDGHYSKKGDSLKISIDFIDENFDMDLLNAVGVSNKNVIKANFKEVTGNDSLVLPSITTVTEIDINGVKGKKIHAEFDITVNIDTNAVGKAKLVIIDKLGRSIEEKIPTIEVTKIDNTKPGVASWNSPAVVKAGTTDIASVTNSAYQTQVKAASTADTNGFRLYKVTYSYDSKKSDFGESGRGSKTGNHDNDYGTGDTAKYFYVVAGNGINIDVDGNLISGTIAGVSLEKTPDISFGDDGKYEFREKIAIVDKAGNETSIDDAAIGPILYVDTQAPRIQNQVLKKKKDAENLSFTYPDNIVRQNDIAQIQYEVKDFNAASSTTVPTASYDYYQKIGSYPEYSSLCATGFTASPIVEAGSSESGEVIKTVKILVGDKNGEGSKDSEGNEIKPGIYVTNSNPGDANIAVYARDLAGNEANIGKMSKIVSVPVALDIVLEDPISNGKFSFVPGDNTKVRIKGKARAREELDTINNQGITEKIYYNLELEKINIQVSKDKDNTLIINKDYTINKDKSENGGDKLSDGWYSFHLDVGVNELSSYAAELFDVTATLTKSGETKKDIADKVSLDSGPPKITSITVTNSTTAELWGKIYKTERFDLEDKMFSEDEILKFSTAKYELSNSFTYGSAVVENLTFDSDKRLKDFDGHFAKLNDILIVRVEFLEENFDTSELNNDSNKNVVKAVITGFGTGGSQTIAGTIEGTPTDVTIGVTKGKKYTAKFEIKVENSADDAIGRIAFDIRDSLEKASSDNLGSVEITKIDNKIPGTGSVTDIVDATNNNSVTLTKSNYKVKTSAATSADVNGFRVFKVYYNYDSTKSDFGPSGRLDKIGNHDKDGTDEGAKYFYVRAGTVSAGATNVEGTSDTKQPETLSDNGDDGKYSYRRDVLLIDKAGNLSSSNVINEKTLLVDTQAPRINSIVLKKLKDKDSLNFTYADDLVRNGDTAQIQYSTLDYNISNSVLNYQKAYSTYVMPEYSKLMATGIGTNPVVRVGNINGNSEEIKGINVYVGDTNGTGATDILGNTATPAIIIGSSATGNVPISVYAKDAAGNEIEVEKSVEVDNTPPAKPIIAAYAWESTKTLVTGIVYPTNASTKVKERNNNNDPTVAAPHFTEGGSERNFFVKLDSLASDVTFAKTTLNNSAGNDVKLGTGGLNGKGNGNKFYEIAQLTDVMPNENGQNYVKVAVRDRAGNLSEDSDSVLIVMDRMVGNRETVRTILGGTAQIASGNTYNFKFNIKNIPEYSGLQKIEIVQLTGGGVTKNVKDNYWIEYSKPIGQELNVTENMINRTIEFSNKPVPTAMQGTRIKVRSIIYDNLGNSAPFEWEFLIPKGGKSSVEIKSQASGSEKEIRTKVKVVGENQFDLEKTEEAGKEKNRQR